MRKLTNLLAITLLGSCATAFAESNEEPTAAEKSAEIYASGYDKIRFGGYGEMAASYMDYDQNRFGPNGSYKKDRGSISIPRFVLAFDYKFSSSWILGAEIEFEYGGTGTAREIEWFEENGEYETEIEKGGEVALEQFHITKLIHPAFNIRAGHIIVPVGLTNSNHEPINFFGVYRPEGETTILPSTWHENGISFFGQFAKFDYTVMMVAGLDANGFGKQQWIASGKQGAFEVDNFNSPAFAGRLNYSGVKGLRLGVSGYYNGKPTRNASKPNKNLNSSTGKWIDAPVTIFTADAQYKSPGNKLIARANIVYGNVQESLALTNVNKRLGSATGYPRTPVAKAAVSYAGEVGYNVGSLFNEKSPRIYPFIRYEYYNPMEKTVKGITADRRLQVSAWTAGINYNALPNLVVKADYTNRQIGGGDYNSENMVSVGIAYIAWFLSK
ncbi:hypothetical protein M1P97_14625 [Parabacteroides sp. GYB001]|uniref:outer membrane beta-barrel protein n=1 Tax=Parabacteroides leei TaxID=2939491 RepID=UPI002016FAAB|nr:outer membrane beta-barrel protein [Parabacteroides leei]MCL3852523.1 hypothetical protein [Parabacteroides leei]